MNRMREAILQSALAPAQLSVNNSDHTDSADAAEQRFCFETDFLGFKGHFPDYPILPAILQTLMAQLVAEQLYGQELSFQGLSRAKFTRELRPEDQILVKIQLNEQEAGLRCKAEILCAEQSAASFTLTFLPRGLQ